MFSSVLLNCHNETLAGIMAAPIKILVIEEDHGTTDLLKTVLEPDCFLLTVASSEQQGMDLTQSIKPDIIILVLDRQDSGGLETCKRFRQSSHSPILVLSSNGKPNFAEQILDVGADDYLSKPITTSLIVASLNKLTRRARAEREAIRQNLSQ